MHLLPFVLPMVLLLLVLPGPSSAADRFVCDCAPGADADCVAGSNSNPGTAQQPWRSYQQARLGFAGLTAGDALRFCRGGRWQVSGAAEWVNGQCTAQQTCLVAAYDAPWSSGDEKRPVIERTDDGDAFSLANPGNAIRQSGYRFEDLHLVGNGGNAGQGFFLFNDIDDVTISRVVMENFAIGVNLAGSNPCDAFDPQCDGFNERIILQDSFVLNNTSQGWLGASSGSRILRTLFDGNGSMPTFHHNLYLASGIDPVVDMQVIGNTLRNNAIDNSGTCNATSLAGHGLFADVLIEGNLVEESLGLAGPGCWGIAIDPAYDFGEQFTRLVIRGNTVRNMGNLSIGTASCVDCVIENNQVIQQQAIGGTAIAVPNRTPGAGDAIGTGLTVRNNSIYYAGPATGVAVTSSGTNHRIYSNAIQGVASPGGGFACFSTDLPPSSFVGMDYNLCDPGVMGEWVAGMGDLTAWQGATGFDLNSSVQSPGFKDPTGADLGAVSGASPMVDTGSIAESAPAAFDGALRDSAPDRGAHEWRAGQIFSNGFEG